MASPSSTPSSSPSSSPSDGPSPQDLSAGYRRYLASLVLFHLAAADEVGLGATDYQASSLLDLDGPLTSGELAEQLGLTTGATTRLIDRLVASGQARRVGDPHDRRRVLVEHTGIPPARLTEILGSVREPIGEIIGALSGDQRAGLARYFTGAAEAYRSSTRELRSAPGTSSPSTS